MQPDGQSLFATCYMIYSRNLFGPLEEKFFWSLGNLTNQQYEWFLSKTIFIDASFCVGHFFPCKSRTALNKCQSFEKFIFNLSCLMESIRILTVRTYYCWRREYFKNVLFSKMWKCQSHLKQTCISSLTWDFCVTKIRVMLYLICMSLDINLFELISKLTL